MINAELTSALFGVAAAATWGAGDFCGGLAAKRTGIYAVVIGAHFAGAVAFLLLAVTLHESIPPATRLAWSAAAGVAGVLGLLALYRALAIGRMGIAAPISGVVCAAVPVGAGALWQGVPGRLTLAGFALAFVAVWLFSRTGEGRIPVRDIGLPVAAGVGFGVFIVIISRVSAGSLYWSLVTARAASLSVLTAVALVSRRPRWPAGRDLPLVTLAGLFDAAGNALVVSAAHAGRLDIAGVLASLYPASTVLLASVILDERVNRWQFAGLVAALSAIVLITLP
jgi:drug/metabolite transporter (DMT)-like permease